MCYFESAPHKPLSAKRAKHHVFLPPRPLSRLPPACRVIDMWLFCCTMDPFICGLETYARWHHWHDNDSLPGWIMFQAWQIRPSSVDNGLPSLALSTRLSTESDVSAVVRCDNECCSDECMYFLGDKQSSIFWQLKLVVIVGVYLFMMQLNDSHDS